MKNEEFDREEVLKWRCVRGYYINPSCKIHGGTKVDSSSLATKYCTCVNAIDLYSVRAPLRDQPPSFTIGTNPKDILGDKKAPLGLVPKVAMARLAKVMQLGAKKYSPYNWRDNNVREQVYIDAARRHLDLAESGEELDDESGQSHYAHAMSCMAILIDAKATGCLVDDRPVNPLVVAELKEINDG